MTLPNSIAIDGPAGSGKSSVCSALARALGYLFVDTGAFYRAVTLAALRADVQTDEAQIVALAGRSTFDISKDKYDDDVYTIWLNGEDVTSAVRSPEVEAWVSPISAMPLVREVLNEKYRQLAKRGSVIMAGRDIGTVVLPNADLKLYLDASPQVRAERRVRQRQAAGQPADYAVILANLMERDNIDSKRATAPLRQAVDAIRVNTDALDISGVVDKITQLIVKWQPPIKTETVNTETQE
jgi:cytidylate kinase